MNTSIFKVVCLCIVLMLANLLNAGGFQLTEMSAKKLGQANAGAAAYGDDASTVYWNPAGLSKLKTRQVSTSLSAVNVESDFDKSSATDTIGDPLTGGEGGDIGKLGLVPATFFVNPGDAFSWGIGIHAPFGLTTDYDDNSIFRYQANESSVTVIDINPAIAWRVNENLSLGLGLDIQYMDVELTSSVDFGAVCLGVTNDPNGCATFGLLPQRADGFSKTSGDGLAYGWNAGIMWDIDKLTLGLSYRSSVAHELEGDVEFTNTPALFAAMGLFQNGTVKADFDSPALTMFSAKYAYSERLNLAADVSHTGWSSFEELRIRFDNPVQPDSAETFGWKDVLKTSVGAEYQYSDLLTVRTGIAFDESPINEAERSVRLPSANRTWLAIGGSYQYSPKTSFDVGYVHLLVDDPIALDRTGPTNDRLIGFYEGEADILSVQFNHHF